MREIFYVCIFLTVNFLKFHSKWEAKTYAEVKVGDLAVSNFPLGHYAQGETHNVGWKNKRNMNVKTSHLDSIRLSRIICVAHTHIERSIHSFLG